MTGKTALLKVHLLITQPEITIPSIQLALSTCIPPPRMLSSPLLSSLSLSHLFPLFLFHFHTPSLPPLLPGNFFKGCIRVAVPHHGRKCFYNYNNIFSERGVHFNFQTPALSLTGLITTKTDMAPRSRSPSVCFRKEFWPPCFLFFALFRSWSMAGATCHCG